MARMPTEISRELAVEAAHLCDEKGGTGIKVLAMGAGAEFDYVVIATAGSERQTFALADEVYHHAKKAGIPYRPVEGEAGWMLVDLFDVVVHVLGTDQREFYQIDRLWKDCRDVSWETEWTAIKAARAAAAAGPVKARKPRAIRSAEANTGVAEAPPAPTPVPAPAAKKPAKARAPKLVDVSPAAKIKAAVKAKARRPAAAKAGPAKRPAAVRKARG